MRSQRSSSTVPGRLPPPMAMVRKPKRFRGKKASTTFSVSVDMTQWIDAEAERIGINRSVLAEDLFEHAIDDYIKELEAEKKKH